MRLQSWIKKIIVLSLLGILLVGCMNVNQHEKEANENEQKANEHEQTLGENDQTVNEPTLNVQELTVDEFFAGKDGTFVLRDIKNQSTFIYNKERAEQRFAPQSTFKVPNSLIGLQVQAVEDEYDIKYWDQETRGIEVWNQDHTLGSGLRHSVVWYYQALARDIWEDRMEEWLQKISYGNGDISGGIDQFWLSSSLQISPIEQTDFMEALYKENLPFDQEVMKTVKRMMVQMEGEDYTLYGKTGQGPNIGWYVGFLKTKDQAYAFATNIASTSADAKTTTIEILKEYEWIND